MSWDVYVYVFFLAHVKFLFAASIAEATTDLNFLEILLSSTFGALFCYNVSYLVGRFIFFKNNPLKDRVFLKKSKKNKALINQIISLVKETGGLNYAIEKMNMYHKLALDELETFDDCSYKDSLTKMINYVIQRNY